MTGRIAGILLFAAHVAIFLPVLRGTETRDVVVGFEAMAVSGDSLRATLRLHPASAAGRTRVTLDDAPLPASFDAAGVAQVEAGPLARGVRRLCAEVRYGGERVRAVCRPALVGTMERPEAPARRGLRVFLPERMFGEVSEIAGRLLREALAERASFLKVKATKVALALEKGGIRVAASVTLTDGTRAQAGTRIAVRFESRRPTLRRLGPTRVSVSGPVAKAVTNLGETLGGAIGDAIGSDAAKEIGRAIGKALAGAAVDGLLKWGVERILDREVLPGLAEALTLPESIALGAEWGGISLALRFGEEPRFEPGKGLSFAFDVGIAAKAAPAPAPAGPGWLRFDAPSPPAPRADRLTVDVSPDLVNLLLHSLWRSGKLRELANDPARLASWDERLADLVVRPAAVDFGLPPLVEGANERSLELVAADVALRLVPRVHTVGEGKAARADVDARLLLRLSVGLGYEESSRELAVQGRLADLLLSCVAGGDRLRPCFGDALRIAREEIARAEDMRFELVRLPIDALNPLSGKGASSAFPMKLVIARAKPSFVGGWIRLDVDASFR